MPTKIEILYWHSPFPGHVALKIYSSREPEKGYYISSECRTAIRSCLRSNSYMDYEDFFQKELVRYGNQCIKLELPVTGLPISELSEAAELFTPNYSIKSNNCAHLAAKVLHFFDLIHNDKIENISYLEPSTLCNFMTAQVIDFKPVTAIEYAYAQINADLDTLRAFANDLDKRKYHDAANATIVLIANIKQELMNFALVRNKTTQEWQKVQAAINKIVTDADPLLSQHRGYKKIIGNILLGILLLGILYGIAILLKKAISGKALFFSDTKTSKVSNHIKEKIQSAEFVPIQEEKKERKVNFGDCYVVPIDFETKERPRQIEHKN